MIRLDDPALYDASLRALKLFAGRRYKGRLVQIFLACKYYGALIAPIGAATGIEMGGIQGILDDLYTKDSRQPGPSVVSLFSANHLLPTGVDGSNIWRNNFHFQKGFFCYATAAELNDPIFRTAHRVDCPHLRPLHAGTLRDATCEFDDSARYRNEDHAKIFRIDPASREIFVHNPADIAAYRPIVAEGGRPLPIAPLVCALYHDSRLAAGRAEVDVSDFLLDFNFSHAEFAAYFDDNPTTATHVELTRAFPALTWTRVPVPRRLVPAMLPPAPRAPRSRRPRPIAAPIPPEDLPASAHPVSPPLGGRWWDAEEAVKTALTNEGWDVIDRRRQSAGFDYQGSKRGVTIFVEVKSSSGPCSPSLTAKEYREASRLADRYILAILENFDPGGDARILWVRNPARLSVAIRTVQVHPLARAMWLRNATVDIET